MRGLVMWTPAAAAAAMTPQRSLSPPPLRLGTPRFFRPRRRTPLLRALAERNPIEKTGKGGEKKGATVDGDGNGGGEVFAVPRPPSPPPPSPSPVRGRRPSGAANDASSPSSLAGLVARSRTRIGVERKRGGEEDEEEEEEEEHEEEDERTVASATSTPLLRSPPGPPRLVPPRPRSAAWRATSRSILEGSEEEEEEEEGGGGGRNRRSGRGKSSRLWSRTATAAAAAGKQQQPQQQKSRRSQTPSSSSYDTLKRIRDFEYSVNLSLVSLYKTAAARRPTADATGFAAAALVLLHMEDTGSALVAAAARAGRELGSGGGGVAPTPTLRAPAMRGGESGAGGTKSEEKEEEEEEKERRDVSTSTSTSSPPPSWPPPPSPINLSTALHRLGCLARRGGVPAAELSDPAGAPARLLAAVAEAAVEFSPPPLASQPLPFSPRPPSRSRPSPSTAGKWGCRSNGDANESSHRRRRRPFSKWPPRAVANALWGAASVLRARAIADDEGDEGEAAEQRRRRGQRSGSPSSLPPSPPLPPGPAALLTPRLENFFLCGMEAAATAPAGAFNSQELAVVAWSAAAAGAIGPLPAGVGGASGGGGASAVSASVSPSMAQRLRAVKAWEGLADAIADALEEANEADRRAGEKEEKDEDSDDDDDDDEADDGGRRGGGRRNRPLPSALSFEPQGVSMVCWSLARARVRHPRALDAAARHALRNMRRYDPQALSNLLWSLATVRHSPAAAAAAVAAADGADPSGPGLVAVAGKRIEEALAESGVEEVACGSGSGKGSERKGGGGSGRGPSPSSRPPPPSISPADAAQVLANYAWAAATLGELTPRALGRLSRRWEALLLGLPCGGNGRDERKGGRGQKGGNLTAAGNANATIEGLGQFWQADALVRASSRLSPAPRALTPALADAADSAKRRAALSGGWATGFANTVFAAAKRCPSASSNVIAEVAVCGAAHRVDVVVETVNGTKVAVEADGPLHFLLSHPRDADGGTANRNVTLAAEGWIVVPVPYFEWEPACSSSSSHSFPRPSSSSSSSSFSSEEEEEKKEEEPMDAAVAYLEGRLQAADAAARELGGGGGCVVVAGVGESSKFFFTPSEAAALGPPSASRTLRKEEEIASFSTATAWAWELSSRSGWTRTKRRSNSEGERE